MPPAMPRPVRTKSRRLGFTRFFLRSCMTSSSVLFAGCVSTKRYSGGGGDISQCDVTRNRRKGGIRENPGCPVGAAREAAALFLPDALQDAPRLLEAPDRIVQPLGGLGVAPRGRDLLRDLRAIGG